MSGVAGCDVAGMVALFGGSFDPVHIAHLIVAEAAAEELGPGATVRFLPAREQPFKRAAHQATPEQRAEMLDLATRGNPRLRVERGAEDRKIRALHGLTRKLIANMAQGVSQGFSRVLDINGVGYRAEVKGQEIHMSLGYSHPVIFPLPQGVTASVERQTMITLSSADRQLLLTNDGEPRDGTHVGRVSEGLPARHGRRRIVPILGGTVQGPSFSAKVVPGGADWQLIQSAGCRRAPSRPTG